MTTEAFIRLENVSKSYMKGIHKVAVHADINLSIPQGSFTALVGPSGCGKTTILNMVGGLDRPSGGRITVDGHEISAMSEKDLSKWRSAHVGFVYQFYNLIPVLNAEENVELPLLLTSLNKRQRAEHVAVALEIVGLRDRAKHLPSELSGGQEQRVAIARAIVSDPAMLVCDEPTGDLDRKAATQIMELLKLLNRNHHKTIVMVTHDLRLAEQCSQVVDLEQDDLHGRRSGVKLPVGLKEVAGE